MKVLQINAVYGKGSTGRIVEDIHLSLKQSGNESYVAWATGCIDTTDSNVFRIGSTLNHKIHAVLSRLFKSQGFNSTCATKKLCKKITEIKPDVIHLHNLHSNYINLEVLLKFISKNNIPTLLTLHDCWFFTGGCFYYHRYNCFNWQNGCENCNMNKKLCFYKNTAKNLYNKKLNLYKSLNNLYFNGVSKWTTNAGNLSILSTAKGSKTIYNWVDVNLFKKNNNVSEIKKSYGINETEKVVLGVSQGWGDLKGLKEFRHIAKNLEGVAKVILVGAKNGNESSGNLIFVGTKNQKELINLYSIANVFVNPSKMETFGLVTIEAMSCEVPVVAYNNTGSAEILTNECGILVEDGNIELLTSSVLEVLNNENINYSKNYRNHVINNYEKTNQINKYINFYKEIISSK